MAKKAVFLDRDGTIIKDKHYLSDPGEVEYLPDTLEALKLIQKKGYRLFLVTNQSGIGRGYFKLEDMQRVHEKITRELNEEGIFIDDIAFCPHAPAANCDCRKPLPKMILDLMRKHSITGDSYMVGDKPLDAVAGQKANIHGVHLTQSPSGHPSFKNLLDFAKSLPENLKVKKSFDKK